MDGKTKVNIYAARGGGIKQLHKIMINSSDDPTVHVCSSQPMTAQRGMISEQRSSLEGWNTQQMYRMRSHRND